MNKKFILVGIVLVAGGAAGWRYYKKSLSETFYYAGTIEATKVEVPARLPTVISEVLVHEGDTVHKGDLLVRLSCDDLKIDSDLANADYTRGKRLVQVQSMPREAFGKIEAHKKSLDLKLDWCEIKAPLDATVLARYREPSEWVAPGVKLLELADLKVLWTYVYVPEPMLAHIKVGMDVTGYLPELAMKSFQGTIVKINEQAEFTPKNAQTRDERSRLVFGVKVGFANPEGILKPGIPIEIQLPDQNHD